VEVSQQLARKYGSLNLTAWAKGLGRLAARLSLVVCADLLRVGRVLGEEEDRAALDDLLAFALSLDYLDLRQELRAGST
jgi:hypothetical protein